MVSNVDYCFDKAVKVVHKLEDKLEDFILPYAITDRLVNTVLLLDVGMLESKEKIFDLHLDSYNFVYEGLGDICMSSIILTRCNHINSCDSKTLSLVSETQSKMSKFEYTMLFLIDYCYLEISNNCGEYLVKELLDYLEYLRRDIDMVLVDLFTEIEIALKHHRNGDSSKLLEVIGDDNFKYFT